MIFIPGKAWLGTAWQGKARLFIFIFIFLFIPRRGQARRGKARQGFFILTK